MKNEQEYWKRFLNKTITVLKEKYYYTGLLKEVLEDKIILDDRKTGEMLISFDNLSLIKVKGDL